jgi:heme exporter protein C
MVNLANPTTFVELTRRLLPWLAATTSALFVLGLWLSFAAPPDYQQGEIVKIMYLHVPRPGWRLVYAVGRPLPRDARLAPSLADAAQKAARRGSCVHLPCYRLALGQADVGHLLGVGAPDLGACVVHPLSWPHCAMARDRRSGRAASAAILTLVGAVDLPIIKFSVDWWNTLHQPASVFRLDGPTIAPELLVPLLVMSLAFTCLFLTLHLMAIRNEILRRRIARVTMLAAVEGDRLAPEFATRGA